MSDSVNLRFVTVKGVRYFRAEDVVEYLRELGGSEETDVRNRLESAALTFERVK